MIPAFIIGTACGPDYHADLGHLVNSAGRAALEKAGANTPRAIDYNTPLSVDHSITAPQQSAAPSVIAYHPNQRGFYDGNGHYGTITRKTARNNLRETLNGAEERIAIPEEHLDDVLKMAGFNKGTKSKIASAEYADGKVIAYNNAGKAVAEVNEGTRKSAKVGKYLARQGITPQGVGFQADTDNDGVPDAEEIADGLNPNNPDTDADGFLDREKYLPGWNANDRDNPGDANYMLDVDSTDTLSVSGDGFDRIMPTVSQDNKKVAYIRASREGSTYTNPVICIAELGTSGEEVVTRAGDLSDALTQISFQGNHVLFSKEGHLYRTNNGEAPVLLDDLSSSTKLSNPERFTLNGLDYLVAAMSRYDGSTTTTGFNIFPFSSGDIIGVTSVPFFDLATSGQSGTEKYIRVGRDGDTFVCTVERNSTTANCFAGRGIADIIAGGSQISVFNDVRLARPETTNQYYCFIAGIDSIGGPNNLAYVYFFKDRSTFPTNRFDRNLLNFGDVQFDLVAAIVENIGGTYQAIAPGAMPIGMPGNEPFGNVIKRGSWVVLSSDNNLSNVFELVAREICMRHKADSDETAGTGRVHRIIGPGGSEVNIAQGAKIQYAALNHVLSIHDPSTSVKGAIDAADVVRVLELKPHGTGFSMANPGGGSMVVSNESSASTGMNITYSYLDADLGDTSEVDLPLTKFNDATGEWDIVIPVRSRDLDKNQIISEDMNSFSFIGGLRNKQPAAVRRETWMLFK